KKLGGEDFELLIRRFSSHMQWEHYRPWYKRRYGYYEKPGELRRKRRKWQKTLKGRQLDSGNSVISFTRQFQRNRPDTARSRRRGKTLPRYLGTLNGKFWYDWDFLKWINRRGRRNLLSTRAGLKRAEDSPD